MPRWKDVDETGDYRVSEDGRVVSYRRNKNFPVLLSIAVGKVGYPVVSLYTAPYEKKPNYVHRLVAKAFIENPDNLPEVNHKDGNKQNNNVANLEWVTSRGNTHHAISAGLWDPFAMSRKGHLARWGYRYES